MGQTIDPADLDVLLTFRRLAADARNGLEKIRARNGNLRMVGGYVESGDILEAYRPLCIPVRRAYRDSDRASFVRVCRLLEAAGRSDVASRLSELTARYEQVRNDLDSHTILNDRPLEHRLVFDAWMDAVIFGSFGGKDKPYVKLLAECGKAVEGVAVRITEAIAALMLELDEVVAEVVT
jgi:hypothetical protein